MTKDQQTWRKEFSGGAPAVVAKKKAPVRKQNVTKGAPSKKLLGKKWMVENYSKQGWCGDDRGRTEVHGLHRLLL